MHIYVYDYFLRQKKYEKIVAKIETRLTDLGLNGKNCQVGPLKGLKSIVNDELRNNPKTIIAIGNDSTLNQVINATKERSVAIGFIPVGGNSNLASVMGIEDEDHACNILSARLIETIDVGTINDSYFIGTAAIMAQGTMIEVDGRYTIEPTGQGVVRVTNLHTDKQNIDNYSPRDGLLELDITVTQKKLLTKHSDTSLIQTDQLIINNSRHFPFTIDGGIEIKTPVEIGVLRDRLPLIIGKNRLF